MKKSQNQGYKYEKIKAKERGCHKGGLGAPDYVRGRVRGEVKRWSRPVDRGELKRLARKGTNEVISKSGFTKPAKEYAKEKGIRLICGKKVIVKKK